MGINMGLQSWVYWSESYISKSIKVNHTFFECKLMVIYDSLLQIQLCSPLFIPIDSYLFVGLFVIIWYFLSITYNTNNVEYKMISYNRYNLQSVFFWMIHKHKCLNTELLPEMSNAKFTWIGIIIVYIFLILKKEHHLDNCSI